MIKVFMAFIILGISGCSKVDIPGIGKVISLSCFCTSEFDKQKNQSQQCLYNKKDWAVSTIHQSFFIDGISGKKKDGVFTETDSFYKLLVPEKKYSSYATGQESFTLNRITLDLDHETYGYKFYYKCSLGNSKV